jgi:hypothetical protein
MPRPLARPDADTVAYEGEVWTDGRGYATVRLPAAASPPEPPLEYQLHNLEGGGGARVSGELTEGRFAIETDEPHVKIAWRVTGRRAADERGTEDAG